MFSPPDEINEFDKYDEPRLHMERLLKAKLVEFDISIRILIPLESAGIRTLGDLTSHSREYVAGIKNIGERSVKKLDVLLDRLMLSFSDK